MLGMFLNMESLEKGGDFALTQVGLCALFFMCGVPGMSIV